MMREQLGRISNFIREHSPSVFCPPCIARDLRLTEREVRERLQIVVGHPASQSHFALTRRLCQGCGILGDYVAVRR
jgi:hypothetical protein